MEGGKLRVIAIMVVAVLAVVVGETLLSKGMKQTNSAAAGFGNQAQAIVGNVYVVGGTVLMTLYFGLYMQALKMADLSFVLPLTAVSYLLGAVTSKYYLHETVTPVKWIGVLIITLGVIVIGLGSPAGSTH